VRWVSQFPADGELQKKRFGKRISDLILGQKSFSLSKPFGVVGSNPLEFWVLDQGAGAIFHVTRGEVKPVRSIQRQGQVFPSLVAMCAGEDGAFYFTDSKLNLVYRTDPDKTVPFSTNRSLSQPTGIAFNSVTGQLWVTETTEHRISVFNRDGTLWKSIGERGTDPGKFNYPTFLWIDRKGKVYIVDSMNFRIQVLDSSGNPVACFGTHGDASGQLARPKGVATDSYGNIYVADALFHVVQIFDPEGKFLYSFGNQGQGEGEFWMPAGIYIDDRDHIYVTDSYNSRIQIFKLEKL
jgi:DNA-binding beta-propeller fold protein YncE